MQRHGWRLLGHPFFVVPYSVLVERVGQLASQLPEGHKRHSRAKFLAQVQYLIFESIPSDPSRPEFRQGNTLGTDHRHWFRAKFNGRYRLFYRFSSEARIIVYAWINDESTLRKAGSKRDPYAMFKSMLESGDAPRSFEDLVRRSKAL
jgi:toxin YhaV